MRKAVPLVVFMFSFMLFITLSGCGGQSNNEGEIDTGQDENLADNPNGVSLGKSAFEHPINWGLEESPDRTYQFEYDGLTELITLANNIVK